MTLLKKTALKITAAALALCVAGSAIYVSRPSEPKIIDNAIPDYFEITDRSTIEYSDVGFVELRFASIAEDFLYYNDNTAEVEDYDLDLQYQDPGSVENGSYTDPDENTGDGYPVSAEEAVSDISDTSSDMIPETMAPTSDDLSVTDTTYPVEQDTALFEINEFDMLTKYNGTDETVVIPENVKEIAGHAFDGNEFVRRVVLYTTIESLLIDAFIGCPNLSEICYEGSAEEWENVYVAPDAVPENVEFRLSAEYQAPEETTEETTAPAEEPEETTTTAPTVDQARESTEDTTAPTEETTASSDETTTETTVPVDEMPSATEDTTAETTAPAETTTPEETTTETIIPVEIPVIEVTTEETTAETTVPVEDNAEETTVPAETEETTSEKTIIPVEVAVDETEETPDATNETAEETTAPADENVDETTASADENTEETTAPADETEEEEPAPDEEKPAESKTVSLVSQLTGISGVKTKIAARMSYFPTSAVVTVTNTDEAASDSESALKLIGFTGTEYYSFDISVFDAETKEKIHELNGEVLFSIGIPDTLADCEKINVYHIENGAAELLYSDIVENNDGVRMVEFTASRFSPFVFTSGDAASETEPEIFEIKAVEEVPEKSEKSTGESEEETPEDDSDEEGAEVSDEETEAVDDEPIIKVTFPSSTSYIINPYHLDVKVSDTESSNASIISPDMTITSESSCKVAVYMSAVAQNVPETVRLSDSFLTNGESHKSLFMYVEAGEKDEATGGYSYKPYYCGADDQLVVSAGAGQPRKLLELDKPEEGSYTEGQFRIFGDTYMPQNDPWRDNETVSVMMVFRVEAVTD